MAAAPIGSANVTNVNVSCTFAASGSNQIADQCQPGSSLERESDVQ